MKCIFKSDNKERVGNIYETECQPLEWSIHSDNLRTFNLTGILVEKWIFFGIYNTSIHDCNTLFKTFFGYKMEFLAFCLLIKKSTYLVHFDVGKGFSKSFTFQNSKLYNIIQWVMNPSKTCRTKLLLYKFLRLKINLIGLLLGTNPSLD